MKLRKGRATACLAVLAVLVISGVSCATKAVGNVLDSDNAGNGSSDNNQQPDIQPVKVQLWKQLLNLFRKIKGCT